jgi:hypothetical protein
MAVFLPRKTCAKIMQPIFSQLFQNLVVIVDLIILCPGMKIAFRHLTFADQMYGQMS